MPDGTVSSSEMESAHPQGPASTGGCSIRKGQELWLRLLTATDRPEVAKLFRPVSRTSCQVRMSGLHADTAASCNCCEHVIETRELIKGPPNDHWEHGPSGRFNIRRL